MLTQVTDVDDSTIEPIDNDNIGDCNEKIKVTVILSRKEMRELALVGMRISEGLGIAKSRLLRNAVREYIRNHPESN